MGWFSKTYFCSSILKRDGEVMLHIHCLVTHSFKFNEESLAHLANKIKASVPHHGEDVCVITSLNKL